MASNPPKAKYTTLYGSFDATAAVLLLSYFSIAKAWLIGSIIDGYWFSILPGWRNSKLPREDKSRIEESVGVSGFIPPASEI